VLHDLRRRAMSYLFDNYLLLRETAGLNMETADIRRLFVMTGSSAAAIQANGLEGEPSAANLTSFADLQECTWTNYTRKQITGRDCTVDTTTVPHYLRTTYSQTEYTALGIGNEVIGEIWYLEGATDALRKPLLFFNNSPTFPFAGGRDVLFSAPDGGVIISGP
jgi:hypothetical protein